MIPETKNPGIITRVYSRLMAKLKKLIYQMRKSKIGSKASR
jgi:hypothetical protein